MDSSVCAYLLKEQGYEVIGCTMQVWREPDDPSGALISDFVDAKKICEMLDIPYYMINLKSEFEKYVIQNFIDEYRNGRTPNPCAVCNRFVKWEAILRQADELAAKYVATGHYADVDKLPNGRYAVKNSVTAKKDQTYVLYGLSQKQLTRTLMPVGAYGKDEIRRIAKKIGLPVAEKSDSQDICFIDDGDYANYILEHVPDPERLTRAGDFIWKDGTVVGQHRGIIHYTIGQRKGLEISLGKRVFVQKIDVNQNRIYLSDDEDLFADHLYAKDLNMMGEERFEEGKTYLGKIRYSHSGTPCRVTYVTNGSELHTGFNEGGGQNVSPRVRIDFDEPVRAVTPGQSVVLYDGDYVVGGGIIET